MKIRIISICISILMAGLLIFIFWFFPVERKLKFKNCEVNYDYFRSGGGFRYKIFSRGPNSSFPNAFWYARAKSDLMRCLCDDYLSSKDSYVKNSIIDSVKNDIDCAVVYLKIIDLNKLLKGDSITKNKVYKFLDEKKPAMMFRLLYEEKSFAISIDTVCKFKDMIFDKPGIE